MFNLKSPWFWFALLMTWLFVACIMDSRQAGTSTTGTNPAPLTGMAILLDGKPATNAQVSLRIGKVDVSKEGIPTSHLVSSTYTDSNGRFSLPATKEKDAYLEIRQDTTKAPNQILDLLEDHFRQWVDGFPINGGDLATFRLDKPGSLIGKLDDTAQTVTNWIGVRGSNRFTITQKDGSFKIAGLCPGTYTLVWVSVSGDTTKTPAIYDYTATVQIKADSVSDVGVIKASSGS